MLFVTLRHRNPIGEWHGYEIKDNPFYVIGEGLPENTERQIQGEKRFIHYLIRAKHDYNAQWIVVCIDRTRKTVHTYHVRRWDNQTITIVRQPSRNEAHKW